jgi:hypothetical protein
MLFLGNFVAVWEGFDWCDAMAAVEQLAANMEQTLANFKVKLQAIHIEISYTEIHSM